MKKIIFVIFILMLPLTLAVTEDKIIKTYVNVTLNNTYLKVTTESGIFEKNLLSNSSWDLDKDIEVLFIRSLECSDKEYKNITENMFNLSKSLLNVCDQQWTKCLSLTEDCNSIRNTNKQLSESLLKCNITTDEIQNCKNELDNYKTKVLSYKDNSGELLLCSNEKKDLETQRNVIAIILFGLICYYIYNSTKNKGIRNPFEKEFQPTNLPRKWKEENINPKNIDKEFLNDDRRL